MNGYYISDNRELHKNGSIKVRIQMLKRPSGSGSLPQLDKVVSPVLKIK
jgi:hypothetical protein